MMAARMYQNTARVHFDGHAARESRFGRRVAYGGHVISIARSLSFNGLANAILIIAINGGRHVAPLFAGDTVYAGNEVLETMVLPARDGIGALLAEGSLRAARSIGGGSERWSMQVKGLEMPGYDPRRHSGLGMGLAMSARGACHNRAGLGLDVEPLPGDSEAAEEFETDVARGISREDRQSLMDALGICKFFRFAFDDLSNECAELLTAVGGPGGAAAEIERLPARLAATRRLFNLREGLTPEDDSLPARLLKGESGNSGGCDLAWLRAEY